ncbi:MAG: type II toxin-antitoxin system PemK/MazF family toxin [Burkholderiales bacterium]|nr:type II toxin-antitoxin system PemK/MazF family toxin [Burkholderiales bacterium]
MALSKFQRGQIWEVDLEPQSHKEEPGKRKRPALVIQTDLLNDSGHPTTIVVVGTSQVRRHKDYFPLRLALPHQPGLPLETDLLIDQVRAISNRRFLGDQPLTHLNPAQLKRVEEALKLLMGR